MCKLLGSYHISLGKYEPFILMNYSGVISAKCLFAPSDVITNIAENFERPLCLNEKRF